MFLLVSGFPVYLGLGFSTLACAGYWPVFWSGSFGLKLIFIMSCIVALAEMSTYGHHCKFHVPAVSGESIEGEPVQVLLSFNIVAYLCIMIISKYLLWLL